MAHQIQYVHQSSSQHQHANHGKIQTAMACLDQAQTKYHNLENQTQADIGYTLDISV